MKENKLKGKSCVLRNHTDERARDKDGASLALGEKPENSRRRIKGKAERK